MLRYEPPGNHPVSGLPLFVGIPNRPCLPMASVTYPYPYPYPDPCPCP
jgi:hypothetical protein